MKSNLTFIWILILVAVVFGISCRIVGSTVENNSQSFQNSNAFRQPSTSINTASADLLCERLADLKEIPYYPGEVSDDPIYNGLIQAGNAAIPCLVEKIADTTQMNDPRIAPHVQNFKVGDAATWLLLYITGIGWQPEQMFPPKYAELWKTQGVYAYFSYVEKLENRKKFQLWWKNWEQKYLESKKP